MFRILSSETSGFKLLTDGPKKSWFGGLIENRALIKPVVDAEIILSKYYKNDSKVTELRNHLENIFLNWVANCGNQLPPNDCKDTNAKDYPPYMRAGDYINDYADLLMKLREEAFQPLLDFESEIGGRCVSALLVLSETANNCFESAIKAYWEILRSENESQMKEYSHRMSMLEMSLPLIEAGHKSRIGYKRRDDWKDKKDCQAIAKRLWEENPDMTIADLLRAPQLNSYVMKYKDKKTIRNWLSKIDKRPKERKTGRPKKIIPVIG